MGSQSDAGPTGPPATSGVVSSEGPGVDDDGAVWMSYLDAGWLAARHGLDTELAAPLSAVDRLTAQVAAR
jgi:hypothetical protein